MSSIFTPEQVDILLGPIRPSRVATRRQGGKDLSYVEAWEIRAHLIRLFGFGGFDVETLSCDLVYQRDVEVGNDKKPGWEVAYKAHVRLTVRTDVGADGQVWGCTYSEAAVGSASGASGLGDLHDNAAKSAVSDALKRCATNLGTQFGLSLYDNGNRNDVVKMLVERGTAAEQQPNLTPEQEGMLKESLGAQPVKEPDEDYTDPEGRLDPTGVWPGNPGSQDVH